MTETRGRPTLDYKLLPPMPALRSCRQADIENSLDLIHQHAAPTPTLNAAADSNPRRSQSRSGNVPAAEILATPTPATGSVLNTSGVWNPSRVSRFIKALETNPAAQVLAQLSAPGYVQVQDEVPAYPAQTSVSGARQAVSVISAAEPNQSKFLVCFAEFITSTVVAIAAMGCRHVCHIDNISSYGYYTAENICLQFGSEIATHLCVSRFQNFFMANFVAVKETKKLQMVILGAEALSTAIRVPLDSACD